MQKECDICGGMFETDTKQRKYCDKCITNPAKARREVQKGLRRIFRATYEPKVNEYVCDQCGKQFKSTSELVVRYWEKLQNGHQTRRVFCCSTCKEQHQSERVTCRQCGKSLKRLKLKPLAISTHFCNDRCKQKWREENLGFFFCEHCGKKVLVRKSSEKRTFCSQECYRQAVANGWRSHTESVTRDEICEACGKRYTAVYNSEREMQHTIFTVCSDKCRKFVQERNIRLRQQAKVAQKEAKLRKKKEQEQRIVETMSLCATCKVPYKECQYMQTNYVVLPKGAHMDSRGKIVECSLHR